jgi:predicted SAM-dependent methyltransferase
MDSGKYQKRLEVFIVGLHVWQGRGSSSWRNTQALKKSTLGLVCHANVSAGENQPLNGFK